MEGREAGEWAPLDKIGAESLDEVIIIIQLYITWAGKVHLADANGDAAL
jgi:hypothetical protein